MKLSEDMCFTCSRNRLVDAGTPGSDTGPHNHAYLMDDQELGQAHCQMGCGLGAIHRAEHRQVHGGLTVHVFLSCCLRNDITYRAIYTSRQQNKFAFLALWLLNSHSLCRSTGTLQSCNTVGDSGFLNSTRGWDLSIHRAIRGKDQSKGLTSQMLL